MKKIILVITTILICIFIAATAFAQTTQKAQPLKGMKLSDATRGIEFATPNNKWGISASKYSVSLNHYEFFDAHVSIKKHWYNVPTAKQAYEKRQNNLKQYMAGAIYLKENQKITLPGNIEAMSMTYKDPADLKIVREIFFIHNSTTYQLTFQVKEENFKQIKSDFGYILKNIRLF